MVAAPPHISIIMCPNHHEVAVPTEPGFEISSGIGVVTRSVGDLIQDCPHCGPFLRHPNGSVEIHVNTQNPISIRPIQWAVDMLLAQLREHVPSEDARTLMGQDGRLRNALEAMRDTWESRGVDYDRVIDAVVEAEELTSESM